jgi:hypothetical protein
MDSLHKSGRRGRRRKGDEFVRADRRSIFRLRCLSPTSLDVNDPKELSTSVGRLISPNNHTVIRIMQFPNLKTKAHVLGVDQFKQKSSQGRIQLMDDFIIS